MVGDWMCFQISLTMWGWLKIRDFCERNRWKFFEQIFVVAYLHVVSFTKHEKDTATKVYLEPIEISINKLFCKQQLTGFKLKC